MRRGAPVVCGAFVCSQASVCSPDGSGCVLPSQLEACAGATDGDGCGYPGVAQGVCQAQVCKPAGCGNGVVEPDAGEVCDDGNLVSLDGCSGDCQSDERCGDGAADPAIGEQCDCGDGTATVVGCTTGNSDMPGATCRADCSLARCGDSILDPFESCDDGNTVPGDGCRADCTGRWTQMNAGTFADLNAVWGSGPDNVYAVGDHQHVLHYDGVKWTRVQPPSATGTLDYVDVWGSGTEVFVLGHTATASRVDRFDGTTWSTMHPFPAGIYVNAIHGVNASHFRVVGQGPSSGVIYHYNAGTWSAATNCASQVGWASVWVDAATGRGWVSNADRTLCTLAPGTAVWTAVSGVPVEKVWGVSATEVYGVTDDGNQPFKAYRNNGTMWSGVSEAAAIVAPRNVGGTAGDALLVGDLGRIMQFDGTTWRISPTSVGFDLADAWGYEPGHVFVVGQNGTILY